MGMLVLTQSPTANELQEIALEFGDYIKVVVDVEKGVVAAGGNLHSDEEKMLLEGGSRPADLWGGGIDLVNGGFDCLSLINIRPKEGNPSQDILDPGIRRKVLAVLEKFFPEKESRQ